MADRIGRKPDLKGILKAPKEAPIESAASAAADSFNEDTFTPAAPKKAVSFATALSVENKTPTRKRLEADGIDLKKAKQSQSTPEQRRKTRMWTRQEPKILAAQLEAARTGANSIVERLAPILRNPLQSDSDLKALQKNLREGGKVLGTLLELIDDPSTKPRQRDELEKLKRALVDLGLHAAEHKLDYQKRNTLVGDLADGLVQAAQASPAKLKEEIKELFDFDEADDGEKASALRQALARLKGDYPTLKQALEDIQGSADS